MENRDRAVDEVLESEQNQEFIRQMLFRRERSNWVQSWRSHFVVWQEKLERSWGASHLELLEDQIGTSWLSIHKPPPSTAKHFHSLHFRQSAAGAGTGVSLHSSQSASSLPHSQGYCCPKLLVAAQAALNSDLLPGPQGHRCMLDFQSGSKRCGPLAAIIHDELRPVPMPKKVKVSPILDCKKVLDPLKQAKFHQRVIRAAPRAISRPVQAETYGRALGSDSHPQPLWPLVGRSPSRRSLEPWGDGLNVTRSGYVPLAVTSLPVPVQVSRGVHRSPM
jgi:hypothetical protein